MIKLEESLKKNLRKKYIYEEKSVSERLKFVHFYQPLKFKTCLCFQHNVEFGSRRIAPRAIASRTIAHQDNFPWIIATPQNNNNNNSNFPGDNCPQLIASNSSLKQNTL